MTLNLFSGTARLRNRRRPILWIGANAQHLAERYIQDTERHPYLHIKAQQTLSRSTLFRAKNGSWLGLIESEKGTFCIPVILHTQFVEIKSCYLMKSMVMKKAKQQKSVRESAADEDQPFVQESIAELQEYGGFSSDQETINFVNESLNSIKKVKKVIPHPTPKNQHPQIAIG